MIGLEEVDDDLEGEIRQECQKYGNITSVHIHSVYFIYYVCLIFILNILQTPNTEEIDQVRIFVSYDSINSAIKALISLNRRFFGGRMIDCRFYDVSHFNNKNFSHSIT